MRVVRFIHHIRIRTSVNLQPTQHTPPVETLLLRGRWAGQGAGADDQGREPVGKRCQGALGSCTLVHLTILCCPVTSTPAELAAARPQAAIFVLVEASLARHAAGDPAPRGALQMPGPLACARSTARTTSSHLDLWCFVWSHVQSVCGHLGRGVSCGSVGVSDGYINGSVTIPYTFLGAGSPLARAAAARKTEIVSTKQDDLSPKQPVIHAQHGPIA